MINLFQKYKIQLLLWIFTIIYIAYFSFFTILRYRTLYASYYDLGIMHQTVYNSYMTIKSGDWSRILELTNPKGPQQLKRMAIHNDPLLALIAPFYFIHSSPETLLIIQTIVVAFGALAIFKIARYVFQKKNYSSLIALVFALSYLLYPPLERSNIFDFHAVTLATTFLLFMFYFWLVKQYWWSFIFFILSILSKEQVALTTMMFGIYTIINQKSKIKNQNDKSKLKNNFKYPILVISLSLVWFIISIFYIIPFFRGGDHFAVSRYSDFGETPIGIIIGVSTKPYSILKYIFRVETLKYFNNLLGPVGFLSLLSPIHLFITLPQFAINLLSNNPNMRNIIYHYTAVITPFVFISAVYGARNLIKLIAKKSHSGDPDVTSGDSRIVVRFWARSLRSLARMTKKRELIVVLYILFFTFYFAYLKGPLPFAKTKNVHPFKYPQKEAKDTIFWAKVLRDEHLKITTTGQLSPFFTARRYFYILSPYYYLADYVLVRLNEIYNYPEKDQLIPVYERLVKDANYELIYQKENFEVYKKVASS